MVTDKFRFLGLYFNVYDLGEAVSEIRKYIRDFKGPRMVFSMSSELIVKANASPALRDLYNRSEILTLDGYVTYYAARLFSKPVREPVSASRIMFEFLKKCNSEKYRIYLLGGTEEIVQKTAENIKRDYPGISIAGVHNGYFDFDADYDIIDEIREKKPDVLFIGMSSPLKENFLEKNLVPMNVPVSIGVGGAFDIIAGKTNLAPPWVSRIGLEWFYRFVQEPRRMWRRYLETNTKFILLLLREMFSGEKNVQE